MADQHKSAAERAKEKASTRFLERKSEELSIDDLLQGILGCDRLMISKAITLVESEKPEDRSKAMEVMSRLPVATKQSRRIGITGPPGAGKSSFIESFGKRLVKTKTSVAVLSIDPSSLKNRGSILGDKTRMEELSRENQVYIRPSAAGAHLGGVHARSRESIAILEAAGFDYIFVETVGVGQSEVAVNEITDCMLLLLTPAGGDELQGIKRGVVELADIILVNKSDGDLVDLAKRTRKSYANALHLFPLGASNWAPVVKNISALKETGLQEVEDELEKYFKHLVTSGYYLTQRDQQDKAWYKESLKALFLEFITKQSEKQRISTSKSPEANSKRLPVVAAYDFFHNWLQTL